jgi:hypothetical protein
MTRRPQLFGVTVTPPVDRRDVGVDLMQTTVTDGVTPGDGEGDCACQCVPFV